METQMESKKVLVVLGSPRKKGNSAALANKMIVGAQSAGAEVETVFIQGMKISPCQSCYACQMKDAKGCAIDDDMQAVYPKLIECHNWILACPVYWFTMSAQMKIFMDRMFALGAYGKNPFHRKRIAIAMSYGDNDPFRSGCVNALRTFQDAFTYTGSKIVGMVYGSANQAGEIENNGALMHQAEELGRKLVS
jgi:multimeric flavodoxin WrbA